MKVAFLWNVTCDGDLLLAYHYDKFTDRLVQLLGNVRPTVMLYC